MNPRCRVLLGRTVARQSAHSVNPVNPVNPVGLIVTARGAELAESGKLADVAPTILALLKIQRPSLVSGHSLPAS